MSDFWKIRVLRETLEVEGWSSVKIPKPTLVLVFWRVVGCVTL